MTDPRMRASPATPIKAFPEALLALTFVGQSQTRAGPPKVILGAGVDTLRRFGRFLRFFDPSIDVFSCRRPPALSGSIDRSIPPDERRELFQALLCLLDRRPAVCLFPDDSLDSPAISPGQFRIRTVALAVGDEVDLTDLIEALVTAGYDRTPIVRDPGSFAVRGSLVDVFPPQDVLPARIDFDDVRIARIRFGAGGQRWDGERHLQCCWSHSGRLHRGARSYNQRRRRAAVQHPGNAARSGVPVLRRI